MEQVLINIMRVLDNWAWLVKLAAIITASTVIWRYALGPMKDFLRDTRDLMVNLNAIYPTLEHIAKDFKPNGGNSLRDVVDRIELNLYLFEQKYRAVVEFQDIGVFETDKYGKYTWVSEKWMQLTNQSWLDASNNGWIADVSSEDRDKVWHEWEVAISQTRQFNMKYKIHQKPYGVKTVSSIAIPVKDKDGKVISYLGKLMDISSPGYSDGGHNYDR